MFATKLARSTVCRFMSTAANPANPLKIFPKYAIQDSEGKIHQFQNKQEYIDFVSVHPDFNYKRFAGTGMKFYNIEVFHKISLQRGVRAMIIASIVALAYKTWVNHEVKEQRAEFAVFMDVHERATAALAEKKAAADAAAAVSGDADEE